MSCNADTNANALFDSLMKGVSFEIPNPDFSGDGWDIPSGNDSPIFSTVTKLTPADITEQSITGSGAFDIFMSGMSVQLQKEYESGRITGAEYTKAFIALTQVAMGSAVQFMLQKDQAFWQAAQTQAQTIAARVGIEQAKVQVAALQLEAQTSEANYALTKLKLSTEEANYCTAQYNLSYVVPAQYSLLQAQKTGVDDDNAIKVFNLNNMLPTQLALVKEQIETQRGQTTDTRTDGSSISGILGEQKALYVQQITSYQRDAEVKAAKLFTDAWVTMKTVDDGLDPPTNFANDSLNDILQTLKNRNDFSGS